MSLPEVPEHLLVIGAGVIGLELGSVWRRLGAQVTVVEFLDGALPGMDGEVRRQAQRLFEKQGMTFKLSSKVTAVDASGKTAQGRRWSRRKGGAAESIEADVVLVAIGRVPYTEGLGLKELGVKLDERGRVDRRSLLCDQCSRHLGHRRRDCRVRCWRTRPRTRAWRLRKFWSGRRVT